MDLEKKIRERILQAVELANTDTEVKKLAKKLGTGKLIVRITNGLSINIQIEDGHLEVVESPEKAKAIYEFSDAQSAWALLNREMSPYYATVHKKLNQQGLSPMNDAFEKLLVMTYERVRSAG